MLLSFPATSHAAEPRFIDKGDGTMYDSFSKLTWLKNANCFGALEWYSAMAAANALANGQCGLSDGTVAGDWHLPTIDELRLRIYQDEQFNYYTLNSSGFINAQSGNYWSSTNYGNTASSETLGGGFSASSGFSKTNTFYVWPVRKGKTWNCDTLEIYMSNPDLGAVNQGMSFSGNFNLHNTGTSAISIAETTITGTDATLFELYGSSSRIPTSCNTLTPTLPAGANCTLIVSASSDSSTPPGVKSAKLTIATAAGSNEIPLSFTVQDVTLPKVNSFTLPMTSTTLTVPVTEFAATDNVGVTGYLITETSSKPSSIAAGWSSTAPTSFTFAASGNRITFYGWAKDAAGNVSYGYQQSIDAATVPTITAFTVPTSSTLTVPVTAFTATDNAGVTGYLITETSSQPLSSAAGWSSTAPTSYTFTTNGSIKTLYAWAKDAIGNISATVSATTNIDTVPPTITASPFPATSTSLILPITAFSATDNVGVTGYLVTETSSTPSLSAATWRTAAPTGYTFASSGIKTLYAWVKDAAGNISGASASIDVATVPSLTAFTLPATSTTLTVPITALTATDNVAIAGYVVSEDPSRPLPTESGWSSTIPASYTFTGSGVKTLYAWVKDAAGNIPGRAMATIDVATVPTITAFTLAASSTSLSLNGAITSFTATDNVGVTGYLITESETPPLATDPNWSPGRPSYTFSSSGVKTVYAFVKDAAGNISARASARCDVATVPTVTAFTVPATSNSLSVPITAFTAADNVAVGLYMISLSPTDPFGTGSKYYYDTPPVSYAFGSSGFKTIYAWARDTFGNISAPVSAAVFVDIIKPTVSAFTVPSLYNKLTVPVSEFTATDDLGVSGYLITTDAAVPSGTDSRWSATRPTTFSFTPATASGVYTLYAWVKDGVANVSISVSTSVTLDIDVPSITAFSVASYVNGLVVPVATFTASDSYGRVTGYLVTETATPPESSDSGWNAPVQSMPSGLYGSPPISKTFTAIGRKTLYAWVKDAAGNVSAPATATFDLCTTTASSDANGTITLPGLSTYFCAQNRLYKIAPKPGYKIADVLVDGLSVGKVADYLVPGTASSVSHTISASFEPDPFANWHQVAPGYLHTLAVRADGTMWSWGDNSSNQLGNGTANASFNPIRVTAYSDWQTAAAGPKHSMARRANGFVYGWGDNGSKQLGGSGSTLPVLIVPTSITDLQELYAAGTASSSYSLLRKADGKFVSLGAYPANSFSAAMLADWVALASGTGHGAAIRADGTVWCWGDNTKGQLGDSFAFSSTAPVRSGSASNWIKIAAGATHTVGLQSNGTLWTWGDNSWGQLGTDAIPSHLPRPLQIGSGQSWKAIAAGDNHTLALRADGTIWAFGNNTRGQLGDGSGATTNFPVQVGTDSDWKSISAHGDLSFGIKNNNTLHAWGANDKGQMGDTTTVDKLSPVLVATNTNSFVITASAGTGGNISPSGITTNAVGTSKTFSIAPIVAWKLRDVKVDGVSVGAVTSFTFNNIIDSHAIVALFSPDNTLTHTITASAGIGASISPSGTINVSGGNSQLFSIAAQANYRIIDVLVDGVSQGALASYTFSNMASSHLIQVVAALLDNTAPTGSISINGGASHTGATSATVTLSATDAASGVSKMRFSLDNVNWSAWETYAASRSYTLPAGDGTKNLYVQYKDTAGNISTPYLDSIILDTLAPTGSVSLNSGATGTTSAMVTATVSASDSGGSVSQMQFSWDNITWQAWQSYAASKSLTVPVAGFNTLYLRFKDAAGNISAAVNDSIVYNMLVALSLTVNGNGTVNSNPSGFTCGSGSCSATYASGTPVTLMATPGFGSTFGGWSGACSGTGNCALTMTGNKTVTTTFTLIPKAKVGSKGFSTLQAAYDDGATTDNAVIELLEGSLPGAFTAGRGISVTLEGGYNATYGAVSSQTMLQAPVRLKAGTVRVKRIKVKQ